MSQADKQDYIFDTFKKTSTGAIGGATLFAVGVGLIKPNTEKAVAEKNLISRKDFHFGTGGMLAIGLGGIAVAYIFRRNFAMLRAKVTGNTEMRDALKPPTPSA